VSEDPTGVADEDPTGVACKLDRTLMSGLGLRAPSRVSSDGPIATPRRREVVDSRDDITIYQFDFSGDVTGTLTNLRSHHVPTGNGIGVPASSA
jgi:hypothetical protein